MSLIDLWNNSPNQLIDKHVAQLIAVAGSGKLLDDSDCSKEFRAFLAGVKSPILADYSIQCLTAFQDSGLALQDTVNEIGTRLGASVLPGRYRGNAKFIGNDGLWIFPSGHSIIVEVKTTDAYRIDLNIVANYRRELISKGDVNEPNSSILLVVGRQDTGDLEAQIRGSRHAWDIRIISVDALLRLMKIKEDVEDPLIVQRIHNILIPREFTRLDAIADVLFSAAEDIKQEEPDQGIPDAKTPDNIKEAKFTPVDFGEHCINRIQSALGITLIKRSRVGYSTPDKSLAINCSISKVHKSDTHPGYWFAFHPHHKEFLGQHSKSFVSFGCGSSEKLLLIPFEQFDKWLDSLWTTEKDGRMYWHVIIEEDGNQFTLRRKKGYSSVSLANYLIPSDAK